MDIVEKLSEPDRESESSNEGTSNSRRPRHGAGRRELRERIDALTRQRRSFLIVAAGLAVLSLGLGVGWLVSNEAQQSRIARLVIETSEIKQDFQALEEEAGAAKRELEQAEARISSLVSQRIPGLLDLEIGQPIEIQDSFVRDITFRNVPKGIEFKAVVENDTAKPVELALEVQFFDEVGVQVGESRQLAENAEKPETLRPGEIRSYFEVFSIDRGSFPSFFRLAESD